MGGNWLTGWLIGRFGFIVFCSLTITAHMKKLIPALALLLFVACNTTNKRDEKIRSAILENLHAGIDSNAFSIDSLKIVHVDSLTEKEALQQLIKAAEGYLSFATMSYKTDTSEVSHFAEMVQLDDKWNLAEGYRDKQQLAYYTGLQNYYQTLINDAVHMRDSLVPLLAGADNTQFRYFDVKVFACNTDKNTIGDLTMMCDTTHILVSSDFVPSRYNNIRSTATFAATLDSISRAADSIQVGK